MPKRDENYMQCQRDAIARTAMTVLIEKGYYETTLRDICRSADISNGALYSYFPTRESVVIAACAIDHGQRPDDELPNSWKQYAQMPSAKEMAPGTYRSRRFRLSLQFVAELTQTAENPQGPTLMYQSYRDNLRRSIARLNMMGIVTLPLGIEMTTDLHLQMFWGV